MIRTLFVHPRPEIRRSAAKSVIAILPTNLFSGSQLEEDMDEKQLHEEREEALILFKWLHEYSRHSGGACNGQFVGKNTSPPLRNADDVIN